MASTIEDFSQLEAYSAIDEHGIYELARQCVESFVQATTIANTNTQVAGRIPALFQQKLGTKPILTLEDLRDDYEQFRVWSRNLGVFAHDHGSLDFRLRGADDIKDGIVSLLNSLNTSLQICLSLLAEDRPIPVKGACGDSDSSPSDSDESTGLDDFTNPSLKSTAHEIQIRFRHVSGIIDKLFRLAEAIRASGIRKRTTNAANYIHIQDGINVTEQFEANYLPFVLRHRFKLTSPLLERFVKAISLRRRRFLYQSRHQKRLAYGGDILEKSELITGAPRVTWSTAESQILRRKQPVTHNLTVAVSDVHPPTKATTFEELPPRKRVPSRIVSGTTRSGINGVEVPSPPFVPDRATHFQCPYCYILIPKDKRAPSPWRDHIIGDLQPFICLEPDCAVPDTTFESQTEWIEHQKWEHTMQWWCDREETCQSSLKFSTAEEYSQHLLEFHDSKSTSRSLTRQIATAGRPSIIPFSCCPLCDFLPEGMILPDLSSNGEKFTQAILSQKQLQKHIADELLSIFLIALPDRDDLADAGTETDQPTSQRDTVLTLSDVSLQFSHDGAASEERFPLQSGPYTHEEWEFLWATPRLQDSVRETYTGIEYDEVLLSMSTQQNVLYPGSSTSTPFTSQKQIVETRQRQDVLESLKFDQIWASFEITETACPGNCAWVLESLEFKEWLYGPFSTSNPGILWIKGALGTGKSTLMKFMYTNCEERSKHTANIASFFDVYDRDQDITVLKIYRSVLYQVLSRYSYLLEILEIPGAMYMTTNEWSRETLESILLSVASHRGLSVVCFVDGLDCIDRTVTQDIVRLSLQMCRIAASCGSSFRFCFSSRQSSPLTKPGCPQLNLNFTRRTNQDILKYVHRHLRADASRAEIERKASGNFLWATLIVRLLNDTQERGGTAICFGLRLETIPRRLEELCLLILRRLEERSSMCVLQYILFARYPLSSRALHSAVKVSTASNPLKWRAPDLATKLEVDCDVYHWSGGLVKVFSEPDIVALSHRSIHEIIMRLDTELSLPFKPVNAHKALKECCMLHLKAIADRLLLVSQHISSKELCADFPFLEYAVTNVFYHSNSASDLRLDQEEFLEHFPFAAWIRMNNLIHGNKKRQYTSEASLLFVLVDQDCIKLSLAELDRTDTQMAHDVRWGLALVDAVTTLNVKVLRSLLLTPDIRASLQVGRSFLTRVADLGEVVESFPSNHQILEGELLAWAAQHGVLGVIEALLARSDVDVNFRNSGGQTALSYATACDHFWVVKLLLEHDGIDVNARFELNSTPLMLAAQNGAADMVGLLLAQDRIDLNAQDYCGWTALLHAIERGRFDTVKLLLAQDGMELNACSKTGLPLVHATKQHHTDTVKLLLTHDDIDVNASDETGRTALSYASNLGFMDIADLLLSHKSARMRAA